MKRVTILVPDDVSEEQIYYFRDGSMTGVQAYIAPDRVGSSKDEEVFALTKKMSAEEIEQFEKALKSAPIMPIPQEFLMPPFATREEFEALRSRVEKLEQESERQCARVIKMQESIPDDLK